MHYRFVPLLAVLLAVSSAVQAQPLRLTTQQQPPYNMEDAKGRQSGLALETVVCALKHMQYPYSIQFLPWLRAQNMVKNGQADGFFPASQNAERDRFAILSETVAPQQWRWYLPADSTVDPTSADFRSQSTVGAYLGSNMQSWLKQTGYSIYAVPYTHDQLLRVLLAGRVQAVLASDLAMQEAIAKAGAEQRVRSVLQQDKPMGVYFSLQFLAGASPDFLPRFNTEVSSCRQADAPAKAASSRPKHSEKSAAGKI